MSEVIICGSPTMYCRQIRTCPTCPGKTRQVVSHSSIWYGDVATCCKCGDAWSDGEIWTRPFRRGWRAKNIAWAKEIWAKHTIPTAEWDAAINAEIKRLMA